MKDITFQNIIFLKKTLHKYDQYILPVLCGRWTSRAAKPSSGCTPSDCAKFSISNATTDATISSDTEPEISENLHELSNVAIQDERRLKSCYHKLRWYYY